ncbi:alpha/beta hydrolase [Kitasatospora sp. Ki12]
MPRFDAGDVPLHYEQTGTGEPLVLVHGSWNDHRSWQPATDAGLRAAFRVLAYDRRATASAGRRPAPAPAARTRTTWPR